MILDGILGEDLLEYGFHVEDDEDFVYLRCKGIIIATWNSSIAQPSAIRMVAKDYVLSRNETTLAGGIHGEAIALAWKAYEKAIYLALETHEKALYLAWGAYTKAIASARKAHDKEDYNEVAKR